MLVRLLIGSNPVVPPQVSHDFPSVPLATLGYKVGPIELGGSITLNTSVYARASTELEFGTSALKSIRGGGMNLKGAVGVSVSGSAKLGARYDHGRGWNVINPPSNSLSINFGARPSFDFDASLAIGLEISPVIEILDVLTVSPTADLYSKAEVDVDGSSCDRQWPCPVHSTVSLDAGVKGSISGSFGLKVGLGTVSFGPLSIGSLSFVKHTWDLPKSKSSSRRRRRLSSEPSRSNASTVETEEHHRRLCSVHGMPIVDIGREEEGCLLRGMDRTSV